MLRHDLCFHDCRVVGYVWLGWQKCLYQYIQTFQVVELLTKDGGAVQVSLWIRQLDADGPCLVVAEPVSCRNVVVCSHFDSIYYS